MFLIFCRNFAYKVLPWVLLCYSVWCVLLYFIVLYCTVLYCPVLYCSTLAPGINPFAVLIIIIIIIIILNTLLFLTKAQSVKLLSAVVKMVKTACLQWILINHHAWNGIGPYTGCHRRKGPNFGRVFLMLNYTDITQNTYIQNWTVTEIMAREVWNFDSCYTLPDCQIHIETGRNMWFL